MQSKDDDCVRNYCAWIFLSTQPSILAIFYDTWPITLQQSGLYSASVVTLTNPFRIILINFQVTHRLRLLVLSQTETIIAVLWAFGKLSTFRKWQRLSCSTSVLVLGCLLMNHVIYLRLRQRLLQTEKINLFHSKWSGLKEKHHNDWKQLSFLWTEMFYGDCIWRCCFIFFP